MLDDGFDLGLDASISPRADAPGRELADVAADVELAMAGLPLLAYLDGIVRSR